MKDLPETVRGMGIGMAKVGRHDAGVEANQDKCEIWAEGVS